MSVMEQMGEEQEPETGMVEDTGENELPEELKPLVDEAVEHLYGDNFEALVDMFQSGGPESFAVNMGTAVNAVLERLEADHGEMEVEAITHLGVQIFQMLLEDLIAGGVFEEVTPRMAAEAIQNVMSGWLQANQGRVDANEAGQSLQELAESLKGGGVLNNDPLVQGEEAEEPMEGTESEMIEEEPMA